MLCAGSSLVAASGGYSSLWCAGFSLRWLPLLQSMGSRRTGFSSCGTQVQQLWLAGSRVQAQQLWRTGLVALWHVGSSRTRAGTRVPCIGRWTLNHCATREALKLILKINETISNLMLIMLIFYIFSNIYFYYINEKFYNFYSVNSF